MMNKTKKISICLNFFILLILIPIVSSTANSSSYSVGMYGTGLVTANPYSTSYNSTSLAEAKATTRNAESSSYTTNVGFFSGTVPYQTVIINSYTTYPTSAVNGSIISFKVSATNAQSIWMKITLPNSTEETITLTNNVYSYYTATLIGTYSVTFYANSSIGALATALDSFVITSSVTPPPTTTPSSGGGGGCKYIWDCDSWSVCSADGKQERICKNTGTCTGTEGKPIEARECSEALFDVVLKFGQLELTSNESLAFNVDLTQTKSTEKIDVQIKYSIIDTNENEIFSQIETRAVETNISYKKILDELKLSPGEYVLKIDIVYGALQKANAEQAFIVRELGLLEVPKAKVEIDFSKYWIALTLLIITALIIIIIKLSRRIKEIDYIGRRKEQIIVKSSESTWKVSNQLTNLFSSMRNEEISVSAKIKESYELIINSIKNQYWLVTLPFIASIAIGLNIVSSTPIAGTNAVLMILTGIIGLFIFIGREKIIDTLDRIIKGNKKPNHASTLIGRKVYSSEGNYVGKVEEVIIKDYRIEGLKVKLSKKHASIRGIVLKWSHIVSCGTIITIHSEALASLQNIAPMTAGNIN